MIFLKKDRPNAKTTYYGSLPARIRNGWNSNSSAAGAGGNNNNQNNNPLRGSWRTMKARNSEKDKENTFGNRPGEHVTIEKDNQNHEDAYANDNDTQSTMQSPSNSRRSGGGGGGPIGTEAMIEQHLERNSKFFKYPPQGYWTRIELSILYSMILEPTIFPASAVCEHIQQAQQEFNIARDDNDNGDSKQPQHFMEPYLYERPPPGQYTAQMTVSYQQFVALLVLAGEEWPAESKVPQALCQCMVQCIVQYADRHGLDRQVELEQGLRKPLEAYSRRRGAKITLSSMWPVYLGAITTALTGTAVPLGLSYIASFALNERHVQKECVAEENRMEYQRSMERAANPEHESLLVDSSSSDVPIYYNNEEEEIELWDDNDKDTEKKQKKKSSGLFNEDDNDEQYSFMAQELKQQQQQQQRKTPTSALAGAGSMLLLANSIGAQQEEVKKPALYVKALATVDTDDDDDDDDLL
eukprot:CAMPEP_0113632500 /NCGR_PEP_ID=MMETSP0017_2-20120614/16895_1 /TAXON_ID=2856 /ORGANISM="Cylindrotheca closterium" /LENGTH=467 /DNA_ID=CAMNT_0000543063 /DNA_START=68 /DNA_END=1471 /DNA_ORIENTATION=+ /assembly_acc=CAM_ASM_000147